MAAACLSLLSGCGLYVEPYDKQRIADLVGDQEVPPAVLGDFYHFAGTFPVTLESRGRGRSLLLDNNFFFIPVDLNGARGELLVDTGAPFAVIQPSLAERAGISITQEGFLWTLAQFHPRLFELRLGVVDRFRIGTAEANNVPILVPTDQVRFRLLGMSTGELGGLLGWANLRNLTTTFDFDSGQVTLDRRPFANAAGGVEAPVTIYNLIGTENDRQGIYIELHTKAGKRIEALVDSGSGRGLIVPEQLATELGVTKPDTLVPLRLAGTEVTVQAETRQGDFDLVVLSLDVFDRNGYRQVVLDLIQQKLFLIR